MTGAAAAFFMLHLVSGATRSGVVFNDARAFGHKKAGSFALLAVMTSFY